MWELNVSGEESHGPCHLINNAVVEPVPRLDCRNQEEGKGTDRRAGAT